MKRFRIDKYIDGKGEEYFRPKRRILFLYMPIPSMADGEVFVEFNSYTDAYKYIVKKEDAILKKKRKCAGEAIKTPLREHYKIEVVTQLTDVSLESATIYLQNAFAEGTGSCRGSFTITGSSDDPGNIKVLIKRSFHEDKYCLDLNYPEYSYEDGAILQVASELSSSSKEIIFMQHLVCNLRARGKVVNEERIAVHRPDA